MTPRGLNARMNSASTSWGCTSQYAPESRMRRAMSCVTCDPKSSMRILSNRESCALPFAARSSLNVVIRRLLGDLDVVHVRFAHPRGSDLDELGARAHLVDGAVARVAHARAQSSHELADDRGRGALVRDAAFDTLRHELVGVHFRVLEVAVARALLHGADGSHAAI